MFAAAILPNFAPGAIALRWAVEPWPDFTSYISVDGVERGQGRVDENARILMDTMTITESRNLSTPNRCSFITLGFVPQVGDRVLVRLGGADNPDRLFAGSVLTIQQVYPGTPQSSRYAVTCNDDSFLLGFKKITGRYTSTSVTTIVTGLMTSYGSGFTTANVETGLATLDEFTFTNETLVEVLQRLAKRIGATVYLDTSGDLHFFVTDEVYVGVPDDLTSVHSTLQAVEVTRDISQMVTRVYVEGGGPNALNEVVAGTTTLPVQDATWFSDAGGTVVSGPQRITYTGKQAGGGGGLVGTGAQPPAAPVLGYANGSGVTSGLHEVTIVWVTGAGRTLPSPLASWTAGNVAAPTGTPVAASPTSGGSITAGAHYYAYTETTPSGETTASPVSNTVTAVAETAAPSAALSQFTGGTFRSNGGLDTLATYRYAYTYWDGGTRETTLSPATAGTTFTGSNNAGAVLISSIPTPPAGFQVRFYRTEGNGSTYKLLPSGQSYGQFAEIGSSGGNDYYIDVKADSQLGTDAPSSNNTKLATIVVSNIPPASSYATDRTLYRTAAGGSQLKLVASIGTSNTSYTDTMADGSLGANIPTSAPTANRIAVSSISVGPSGTTSRELYMSAAGGGGTRRLALTIGDNTTTTGTITIDDATLAGAAAEPGTDTSGLTQPAGQVNAGSTSLPVAGLGGFASAGWADVGNSQCIRYTGKSSTALTGIPASGVGSIMSTILYNAKVTAAPMLTGIPASGAGSIQFNIQKGDPVNLLVTVNDVAAQAELAALIGGDGIREDYIQDRRLSEDEARARGQAYLDLRAEVAVQLKWRSRDRATRAGRNIAVDLPAPHTVCDTFEIQSVTMSNFQPIGPWFDATASNTLFTLEELLRMARDRSRAA